MNQITTKGTSSWLLVILPIGTSGYNEIHMILPIGTSGYDFTWLDYITDSPDRNIGVQYISEYIPKLQIHQHSLLTRKVFSWHNTSVQVLFYGSSSKLDHHWIIIKGGSSSKLDHHWIIIKAGSWLDHHQNWIITGSSSKLDHHHYHCFCYLNKMVLSLHSSHLKKFYRAIPFSCWL